MSGLLLAPRFPLPALEVTHGEGPWLFGTDGRRYFDASSGSICANIGHAHPHVVEAVRRQAATLAFANPGVVRSKELGALAELLLHRLGRESYRIAFAVGGTGAIELAISLARQYQRRRGHRDAVDVLTASLGYHGCSAFTLALSGHRRRRPHAADSFGLGPSFHSPYGRKIGLDHDCTSACASEALDLLTVRRPAAVLVEPVNGATGGGLVPPDGYLSLLRAGCREEDVLVIHDEVLTGLGRCGHPLAADAFPGAEPDLVVISKGLAAGYAAISAVLVAPQVAEVLESRAEPLPLTGTMTGTPLAAATALAVQEVLHEAGVYDDGARTDELGTLLFNRLGDCAAVADIRGMGWFYGLELQDGGQQELLAAGRANGLVLYPFNGFRPGDGGQGVLVAPPLTSTPQELTWLVERLARSTADMDGG